MNTTSRKAFPVAALALFTLGLSLTGCSFSPSYPEGTIACGTDQSTSCPSGFTCVAGFCRSRSGDASTTGTPDGQGTIDAGSGSRDGIPRPLDGAATNPDTKPMLDTPTASPDATVVPDLAPARDTGAPNDLAVVPDTQRPDVPVDASSPDTGSVDTPGVDLANDARILDARAEAPPRRDVGGFEVRTVCTPEEPVCVAYRAGLCTAQGANPTTNLTDCFATAGGYCQSGECVKGTLDVLESDPGNTMTSKYVSDLLMLTFFQVTTGKTVRRIEQFLAPPPSSPATLNARVYEASSVDGPFTLVGAAGLAYAFITPGYQSSTQLSVNLVPGRVYAIGFTVLAGSITPTSAESFSGAPKIQTTSFGTLLGACSVAASSVPAGSAVGLCTPQTNLVYPLRLTTVP